MSKETGGAAFPRPTAFGAHGQSVVGQEGMTLRDYFAAKALAGFCAGLDAEDDIEVLPSLCYDLADAMLEARK